MNESSDAVSETAHSNLSESSYKVPDGSELVLDSAGLARVICQDKGPEEATAPSEGASTFFQGSFDVDVTHSLETLVFACQLLRDASLVDVTLSCGGQRFPAHRLVLAAHSKFFHHLLVQSAGPSVDLGQDCLALDCLGLTPAGLQDLLEFMYCGRIKTEDEDAFMVAAEKLGVGKALLEVERRRRPRDDVAKAEPNEGENEHSEEMPQVTQTTEVKPPTRRTKGPMERAKEDGAAEEKTKSAGVHTRSSIRRSRTKRANRYEDFISQLSLRRRRKQKKEPVVEKSKAQGQGLGEALKEEAGCIEGAQVETSVMEESAKEAVMENQAEESDGSRAVLKTPKKRPFVSVKLEDGKYKCLQCDFEGSSRKSVSQHATTKHKDGKSFSCEVCGKSFKLKKYLIQHQNVHSDLPPPAPREVFECKDCGMKFSRMKLLKDHFLETHRTNEEEYACGLKDCSYVCQDPYSLERHKQSRHHKASSSILCEVCGKEFSSVVALKHHVNTVHGKSRFPCSLCAYRANTKFGLVSHLQRIHDCTLDGRPASRDFQCESCGFSCFTRQEFRLHQLKHTGRKPHQCPVCDFSSAEKGSLTKHLRLHTGEKPYQCDLCPMKFSHPAGIARHRIHHTGIKPHQCPHCPKAYIKRASLEAHLAQHTHVKPFACHLCAFACLKRPVLNAHLRRQHGLRPPSLPPARYKRRNGQGGCELVPITCQDAPSSTSGGVEDSKQVVQGAEKVYTDLDAVQAVTEYAAQGAGSTVFTIEGDYNVVYQEQQQQQQQQQQGQGIQQGEQQMAVLYNMDGHLEYHPLIVTPK